MVHLVSNTFYEYYAAGYLLFYFGYNFQTLLVLFYCYFTLTMFNDLITHFAWPLS